MKFAGSLTLKFDGAYYCGHLQLPSFASLCVPKKAKAYVEVMAADADAPTLALAAKAGIEWLIANEPAAAKAVIGAAKKKYPAVDLRMVAFHTVENGKLPYLGFIFGSEEDTEHGFGVMLHGTRVVKVGHADVAVTDAAATSDKRKKKPLAKT